MKIQTVKSVILNTLRMFPVEFEEEDVAEIEKKMVANYSTSHSNSNLLGFAHVIARNWAVNQLRKRAVAAKRKARSLLEAEKKREKRERFERCKEEFDNLVSKLLPHLVCSQDRQLDIVRLTCFEGLTNSQCAESFPGTSENVRFQWKHRGIQLLLAQPEVSADLREFLGNARMRIR